ncbi:pro-FMRFamide-related neuropeptide FF like, partial [Leucoraja erinacea]|uniref:pro-FMRFamide-related neuropeptide FF like n=1 Tax=Leucoraja erinaceus TaxID=7782 RepID=UPI0024552865
LLGSDYLQNGDGYSVKRLGSDHTLNALLNSIIHVPEKAGRNPSFVFEPQRFGRAAQRSFDSGTEPQIHYQDWEIIPSQIWSMTMPQRFGKKK